MNTEKLWYGLLGLFACCSVGLGEVQYISASRSVTASATVWPVLSDAQSQNDIKQSTDNGAFNQTALVDLTLQENLPDFNGNTIPNSMASYATAAENSSLTQEGISESGSLDYYTMQTYSGNGVASAQSSLSVTFSLDSEYSFFLFFLDGLPSTTATLTDLNTGQIWDKSTNPEQGVLFPGNYTLTHVLDYGAAYHDSSLPVNFGLEMNLSDLGVVPETSEAIPEPAAALLLIGAWMFIDSATHRRQLKSETARCH